MKVFRPNEELIDLLISRKLNISNRKAALKILDHENYYYLINGYKDIFINSTVPNDSYRPGAEFNEIVALYVFDRNLRELLLVELLRVEHVVKTRIAYIFSKYHGHDNNVYLKPESFNVSDKINAQRTNYLISEINKLILKREKTHGAIKHYTSKYGYVPLWVLSKILTFGKINSFYACMFSQEKDEVAAAFGLSAKDFKAVIDFIATLRNKCAHGERIFCHAKDIPIPRPLPILPEHDLLNIPRNNKGNTLKYGANDILALLITLKYFLNQDRYDALLQKIDDLLHKKLEKRLHSVNIKTVENIMGLNSDWLKLKKIQPAANKSFTDKSKELSKSLSKWTVKDYYNPKIKAEVILDTLLSEDIEKLLENMICKEKEVDKLPGKVTLLAKEFPIDNFKETDNRNRAVDYLVSYTEGKGKDNKLFFVELKTTDENFDNNQLENYIRFCGRVSGEYSACKKYDYRLFPFFFYKKVCTEGSKHGVTKTTCEIALNGAQNLDELKKRERSKIAFDLKDNAKYVFQLAGICRALQENKEAFQKALPEASWPKDDFYFHKRINDIRKLMDDIEEVFKDYKICLVYVSMMNIAFNIEEAINNIEEKDMNLINDNVYNVTLVNDCGFKSKYVKVYNGFSVLSGYMRDILERIVKYHIN